MNIAVTATVLDGKEENPVEQYLAPSDVTLVRPDSFLQSGFWTTFKASHGWQKKAVLVTLTTESAVYQFPFYALIRTFKRLFSLAYIPLAPCLTAINAAQNNVTHDNVTTQNNALAQNNATQDNATQNNATQNNATQNNATQNNATQDNATQNNAPALLAKIATELKPLFPANTVMIRFDPPEYSAHTAEETPQFPSIYTAQKGIYRATSDVQPPDSVILDLSLSEDNLLAAMKQKWRYNIRLGEKKGVQVTAYTGQDAVNHINDFYALYGETSARDGIAVHAKSYYADLLQRGTAQNAEVRLYMATHENDNLAAIITLFCTTPTGLREAIYLYGASSNTKRNLMPAYSLQWRAIQDAKNADCARYDFYGIPPTDDETHPMYGLYRFKTGFGGHIIHRSGSIDIPLKPLVYALFRCAEHTRAIWFKRIKKLFITKKSA